MGSKRFVLGKGILLSGACLLLHFLLDFICPFCAEGINVKSVARVFRLSFSFGLFVCGGSYGIQFVCE